MTQLIDITKPPRIRVFADERTAAMIKAAEGAPLPPLPCSTPLLRARDDMVFMVKAARRRQAKVFLPPLDGLRTPVEAARKLRCSIKTLFGHVASGVLRYVDVGHGRKRRRIRFTDADLNEFIANQTRKVTPCPSTRTETAARRISTSTSKCEVIGFTARRNARRAAKPKK